MEKNKSKSKKIILKKYGIYYVMFIPCAVLLIMFSYVPMAGICLAFKDFYPKLGIFASPAVNPFFKYFEQVFTDYYFWQVFKNTIILSFLRILFGFPCTVILALLFNELRTPKYAKFVQTILFIPYFISWIVMSGMIRMLFGTDGLVNVVLSFLGLGKVSFLTESAPFLLLIIFSDIWKTAGYGMIVYLAAISSIDNCLYEAVEIDGGNRIRKMCVVTLPGIRSTLAIQLILSVSGVLNGGFDQIFNLYSAPVYDVSDIIDTYVYRIGIDAGKVEFGTALGLFKSVVGLILVLAANKIAKLFGGEGIW